MIFCLLVDFGIFLGFVLQSRFFAHVSAKQIRNLRNMLFELRRNKTQLALVRNGVQLTPDFSYILNLMKKANLNSTPIDNQILFLVNFLFRLESFLMKSRKILKIFIFRTVFIFFLSIASVFFLKVFYLSEQEMFVVTLRQVLSSVILLVSFPFLIQGIQKKVFFSFFYCLSFTSDAKQWLAAYLCFDFQGNNSYVEECYKLSQKMLFSGISSKKEQLKNLELWLSEKQLKDEEQQEKISDLLPLFEIFYNAFILFLFLLPFFLTYFKRF